MQAECCDFQLDEVPAGADDFEVIEDGEETQLLLSEPTSAEPDSLRFFRFGVDPVSLDAPEAGTSRGRVLVVDDDGAFALTCARMLDASGYAVRVANDGRSATRMAIEEHFDAIVTDINLPDQNGIQVLQDVRKTNSDMPVILVTGAPDLDTARAAVEWGAISYLLKPVSAAQLERELDRALHRRRTTSRMQIVEDQVKEQEDLSERFSQALRGLWMAFQPIVSWSHKSIVGYQAVMQSTEPSLPTPAALLNAAQELSQIGVLGQRVRSQVAAIMSSGCASQTIFVGLHPAELLDENLYDRCAPLAPFAKQICFEITQTPTRPQVPAFRACMKRLRALGYRIAIGDISAGQSGLGSLTLLEPDAVKLDMSVFRNTESLRVKRKLIGALVALCEDLGSPLIATGVDSEAERTIFTGFSGDLMQGGRFAEPAFPFPTPRF
jgi:EAL domain-containing protein (putative c-di-GMP-specific phosphodiesterase class I)